MSINDASRGMLPDIGEQKTDAKEPVRGELVVVSQSDHDTMRHQISRSPDAATVVERQHCSAPRCSSAVKRQRSPSPSLSILQSESYTVDEEGKPVKRVKRELTQSPSVQAVKSETEDDDVLDGVRVSVAVRVCRPGFVVSRH